MKNKTICQHSTKKQWLPDATFSLSVVHSHHVQGDFAPHDHEFSELVFVESGSALHITEGHRFPIVHGDVFLINERNWHGYEEAENLRIVNILFSEEQLDLSSKDLHDLPGYHAMFLWEPAFRKQHQFMARLQLKEPDLLKALYFCQSLEKELLRKERGYRYAATGIFMQLVVFLSRAYSGIGSDEGKAMLHLGEAISYMNCNFRDELNIAQLAQITHLSERHFHRIFRQTTGKTPWQYLTSLRIESAKNLLSSSDASVSEVAYLSGFSDSNYFSRCFRTYTGVSPLKYRRQWKQ